MPEPEKKENFWTTLPGVLTGVAALLTAITGLWIAIAPHSSSSKNEPAPPTAAVSSTAKPSTSPADTTGSGSQSPAATAAQPAPLKGVTLTSRKGIVTHLAGPSFRHNYTGETIQLDNGQTIAFEKIRSIDFLTVNDDAHLVAIRITLEGGDTVDGSLATNYAFEGDSNLGPFTIFVQDIRQIAFER